MIRKYLQLAGRFIEENRYSGVAVSLVSFLMVALFCLTTVYERFELNLYDLRFKLKPSIEEWDRLAFLDIDENSLTIVGQFPWPRDLYARGMDTMKGINVAQASYDMMFLDESPLTLDPAALDSLKKKIEKEGDITLADLDEAGLNKDRVVADSIASLGRVVLSYTTNDEPLHYDVLQRQKKESFKKAQRRFFEKASVKLSPDELKRLASLADPDTKSISYPIPAFMDTAHSFGFVNRETDIDGTVRKVQLVTVFEGRMYFNLAMVMLMDACRVPLKNAEVYPGRRIVLKKALHPLTHTTEDIVIPIDERGMMYVSWAGSGRGGRREDTFRLVPFYALLEYPRHVETVKAIFKEEDRLKSEQLAGLEEQLEDFTDALQAADGDAKRQFEAGIGELKKRISALKENDLLADLEARMTAARAEYESAADPVVLQKKWEEILDLKKRLNRTKLEYQKNYAAEIERLKKEIAAGGGQDKREQLRDFEFMHKAMELAIRVEDLADSIVLIGLTAAGTQDIGSIPLHNEYARVGTYHNTINTIVQNEFIRRVNWPANLVIMLFIALSMGFVIQRLNAKRSLTTMLATFIVLNAAVMLLFALCNVWLQQVGIALAMFVPALAIVAIKFMREESQKRFIKSAFSYYLSPSVIDEIIKDPDSLELGGEDREITIFFSDIKGFSTISEKLTPRELVVRLNEYLTEMTDIILKYSGTVDKYIGDAIMAFYGAPVLMPDHHVQACLAAIDMKKRLRELQEKWRKEDVEPIFARMGIHSGKATVGNMGSRTRMDYTVMGDAVNLASRLEGANKSFNTAAMISGSTYEGARKEIDARQLGRIKVVGKQEAVAIYELMGRRGQLPGRIYEMLEKYNQGREYFTNRDWKQARTLFRAALKIVPDDAPSRIYAEQCDQYIKNPPPRGWDGVFVLKTK